MIRGGSYRNDAERCRSAYRNRRNPRNDNDNVGFRLVLPSPWGARRPRAGPDPCAAAALAVAVPRPSAPVAACAAMGRRVTHAASAQAREHEEPH